MDEKEEIRIPILRIRTDGNHGIIIDQYTYPDVSLDWWESLELERAVHKVRLEQEDEMIVYRVNSTKGQPATNGEF